MAIQIKIGRIPQTPGVYFFKNKQGVPVYIGKASNLRVRLRLYVAVQKKAQSASQRDRTSELSKTALILAESRTLSWEKLSSDTEALIRESELIKQYRPKFNVLMRDDKQYFFVGFTNEKFPKISVTHQTSKSSIKLNYIGPFTDGGALKAVLRTLRRIFPYCTCKQLHIAPCLNAKIGKCPGVCCLKKKTLAAISSPGQILYQKNIAAIKKILLGQNRSLVRALTREMKLFSHKYRYEEAGIVRNQIRALEKIFSHAPYIKQDLASIRLHALQQLAYLLRLPIIQRIECFDISNIQGSYAYGSMVVFINGLPQTNLYRIFKIKGVIGTDDPRMIHEIILRRLHHPEWSYPEVIVIDGGLTQLGAALSAKMCTQKKLKNNALTRIKIIALAKREEELRIPGMRRPIQIKKSSQPLSELLTHARNESHRFAIKHYRNLHRKKVTHSTTRTRIDL